MTINIKKVKEKFIYVLTIMLLSSIYIFGSYTWGKYIILAISFIMLTFSILKNKGKYKIKIDTYHIMFAIWIIFTFCSSIWALHYSDAIQKGITFIQIFICMFILYNSYSEIGNISILINSLKWTSYIVSVYVINYYGFDFIMNALNNTKRLDSSFINANTLGLLSSIGILLQFNEIITNKKMRISDILGIANLIILIVTQSKKAIISTVVGIFAILIIENWSNNQKKLRAIFKMIFKVVIVGIILIKIFELPIFSGIMNRFDLAVNSLVGNTSKAGASTEVRKELIKIGLNQFKETPILGIGVGNPHYLAFEKLNFDAYLHNNFAELLAGGGIIGFFVYYNIYIYIIIKFLKYRKYKNKEYNILCVFIILLLIMDVGMVSCYEKITYFYFMIFFFEIQLLKNNYKLKEEVNEINKENNKNFK